MKTAGKKKPKVVRVLLVDDHEMVREGLAQILGDSEGIRVVGQAGGGAEALKLAKSLKPDIVVLDYSMPGGDAPGVVKELRRLLPEVKILILTVHESDHYAVKVMESGAHGFIIKSSAVRELVDAIAVVQRGQPYLSAKVSAKVMQRLWRPKKRRIGLEGLSEREFDVLRLLGSGLSLNDCAGKLKISISTASTYRSRLMEKLSLTTTAELIRFSMENDVVG